MPKGFPAHLPQSTARKASTSHNAYCPLAPANHSMAFSARPVSSGRWIEPGQVAGKRAFLTFAGHSGIALPDAEAFTRHMDVLVTDGRELTALARLPHSWIARGTAKWQLGRARITEHYRLGPRAADRCAAAGRTLEGSAFQPGQTESCGLRYGHHRHHPCL